MALALTKRRLNESCALGDYLAKRMFSERCALGNVFDKRLNESCAQKKVLKSLLILKACKMAFSLRREANFELLQIFL